MATAAAADLLHFLGIVTDQVILGRLHWRFAMGLRSAAAGPAAEFRWVLLVSSDAHLEVSLCALFRLFDQGDAVTLSRVRKMAGMTVAVLPEEERESAQAALYEAKLELRELEPVVKRLRAQRNACYSHLDHSDLRQRTVQEFLVDNRILHDELASAWAAAVGVVATLHSVLLDTTFEVDEDFENPDFSHFLGRLSGTI